MSFPFYGIFCETTLVGKDIQLTKNSRREDVSYLNLTTAVCILYDIRHPPLGPIVLSSISPHQKKVHTYQTSNEYIHTFPEIRKNSRRDLFPNQTSSTLFGTDTPLSCYNMLWRRFQALNISPGRALWYRIYTSVAYIHTFTGMYSMYTAYLEPTGLGLRRTGARRILLVRRFITLYVAAACGE